MEIEFENLEHKLEQLSPDLRKLIITQKERDKQLDQFMDMFYGGRQNRQKAQKGIISNYLLSNMLHCNAGALTDAACEMRKHIDAGGTLAVSLAGALSTFQVGIGLSEMIRAGMVSGISATGANHEESCYRYVAHSWYAYIPHYVKLTREQELELAKAGFRRITDTFLPENESVRIIEPHLVDLWDYAERNNHSHLPDYYFAELFKRDLIKADATFNPDHCWLKAAHENDVAVFVPGFEDSTMGNIFSSYTYQGRHKKADRKVISTLVMRPGTDYMHKAYDWYMDKTVKNALGYLQLGGGIAADSLICTTPSLIHDLELDNVKPWKLFVEVNPNDMALGSYSGAGGDEKITWDKLDTQSYSKVIKADATLVFPLIAAMLLDM